MIWVYRHFDSKLYIAFTDHIINKINKAYSRPMLGVLNMLARFGIHVEIKGDIKRLEKVQMRATK